MSVLGVFSSAALRTALRGWTCWSRFQKPSAGVACFLQLQCSTLSQNTWVLELKLVYLKLRLTLPSVVWRFLSLFQHLQRTKVVLVCSLCTSDAVINDCSVAPCCRVSPWTQTRLNEPAFCPSGRQQKLAWRPPGRTVRIKSTPDAVYPHHLQEVIFDLLSRLTSDLCTTAPLKCTACYWQSANMPNFSSMFGWLVSDRR